MALICAMASKLAIVIFYFLNNNDKSFHIPLETVLTGDLWRDFEDTLTRKGLIDAVSEWDQESKKTNLN